MRFPVKKIFCRYQLVSDSPSNICKKTYPKDESLNIKTTTQIPQKIHPLIKATKMFASCPYHCLIFSTEIMALRSSTILIEQISLSIQYHFRAFGLASLCFINSNQALNVPSNVSLYGLSQ